MLTLLLLAFSGMAQGASLAGVVTDPSGAVVPDATVSLGSTGKSSTGKVSVSDREGRYRFDAITPGQYSLQASHKGFAQFDAANVAVDETGVQTFNIQLRIGREINNVTVSSNVAGVDPDPTRNGGQIVIAGSDLEALSDDPDDLAKDLQALAGPSPGSEGPDFFIDGFTGGRMPPRSSIREIRINQNPFSSEFDRVGFGRIEISTKPGSDHFHGQASFDFANRALTARNPYLLGNDVPKYDQIISAGNLSGPLTKRASFFLDTDRRIIDENSLVSYTSLDAGLNPVAVSGAIVTPTRRFSVSPRVDYALSAANTLAVRYSWLNTSAQDQGIATQSFDLASQGYSVNSTEQNVQVTDTAVVGAKAVNDTRFQFLHTRVRERGVDTSPEIDVQGAFTGGGTFPLNTINRDRYEFQNYTTLVYGRQTMKWGARLREDRLTQETTTNFNGRFVFAATSGGNQVQAIDLYRQNQLLAAQGLSQAQIAAQGFGPSEFLITAGTPFASESVFDAGLFLQDDWRLRRNLTVSTGIRYEAQTGISNHGDVAPRLGLAWSPLARTVIRAGAGIFYDRFTSDLELKAAQLNGINQVQYIVRNPNFYPAIPDPATLAGLSGNSTVRSVYQVDAHLHVPYMMQTAIGIERQLPHNISLALNYTNTRGDHALRTRDINAPLPTAINADGQAAGPRPFGTAAGDIYQIEGSGIFRQKQLIASANGKVSRRLSLYGYYVYGRARSDTDGASTFAGNPYDLRSDYGRAAFDVRHRAFISGNIAAPFGVRFAPFIYMQSGLPYNMTSGQDTNGDGNPNDDRPAFAQNARSSVVSVAGLGAFDTQPASLVGAVLAPRNYLQGPGIFLATVRVSRTWTFGESGRGGGNSGSDEIRGGGALTNGGLSSQAGTTGGIATAKRYNLTFNATFRNLLNNVNPALPIGSLSSPLFGKSVALSTYGPLPGIGPNAAGGNRHIELQLRFNF